MEILNLLLDFVFSFCGSPFVLLLEPSAVLLEVPHRSDSFRLGNVSIKKATAGVVVTVWELTADLLLDLALCDLYVLLLFKLPHAVFGNLKGDQHQAYEK